VTGVCDADRRHRPGWPKLLDPAQDRSAAHVDPPIGKHAGDAFGSGTQLQVVPNSEQDDVTRETMT
jgi:hypothetical protein